MNRNQCYKKIVWSSLIVLCTGNVQSAQHPKKTRPHILLIFTDQQQANAMSIVGNTFLNTPNMDALARDGIRFANAYCTSPVSGPSRASLVTGLMAREAGVDWNDNSRLSPDVQTVGHLLGKEGYRSVWAGKWHVPEIYPQRKMDKTIEMNGFEYLPFWNAPDKQWLLGAETDPPLTKAVVDFLETYSDDRPLFLAVSYHNPHDICMFPRKEGWENETDSLLQLRPFGKYKLPRPMGLHPDSLKNLPPLPANFNATDKEPEFVTDKRTKPNTYGDEVQLAAHFTKKEWQAYLNAYYRLTELVDIEIGKVIDALKRNNMYENTLIVFTSDHGDGMGAHQWASKLSFYEESVKVPFIIVPPGSDKKESISSDYLVSLADIVPTFCDYASVSSNVNFAGKSLRCIMEGKRTNHREYVVTELADNLKDKSRKGRMIRTERYKYAVYSSGRNNEQFFDLKKDPGETRNLAFDVSYKKIVGKHRLLLKQWMKERNDDFKMEFYDK